MYKVVKLFTDLKDGNHLYNVGDFFPRNGVEVSKERLEQLSSSDNAQGTPLIELVKEEKKKEKKEEIKDEPKEEIKTEKQEIKVKKAPRKKK